MNKREIGSTKENKAADYLSQKGYRVLAKNYRVRQAEIDIVCSHEHTLVFVEVKYRSDASKGFPAESVDIRKQKRISKAALFYMNAHHINPETTSVRFDVIAILQDEITHYENAFDFLWG